jgi:hypothetical protein
MLKNASRICASGILPVWSAVIVAEVCPTCFRKRKNKAAYRTVLLADAEGKLAMKLLQESVGASRDGNNGYCRRSTRNLDL